MPQKSQENKLRRKLSKMGFVLAKSRARNLSIDDFGGYKILDGYSGYIVEGERYQLELRDIEEFINEEP